MQLWSAGAADGQGGGQSFGPWHGGGGQDWLGGTGSAMVVPAGAGCTESHGGGGGGHEDVVEPEAFEQGGGQA